MVAKALALADGSNFTGYGISAFRYGAKGDGTDATAGISDAKAAAEASGYPTVFLKPGLYPVSDPLVFATDYTTFLGHGATILFQGDAVWQLGSDAHAAAFPEFVGLTFKVDASSTAEAPLLVYSAGQVYLKHCVLTDLARTGIDLKKGVLWLQHCRSRMATGAGNQVIRAAMSAGDNGAIFIQGGRFNSGDHADKRLITHGGVGQVDGLQLLGGVNTAGLDHVVVAEMASGGHLANMKVTGGIFDQVDQEAIKIVGAAGASVSDIDIGGCKINGSGGSTKTSGALVSIDMTAGTHSKIVRVCDNYFDGARDRGAELIGTFKGAVLSRNAFNAFGTRGNAATRAAYISGSFEMLEVAENNGHTTYAHDRDIEFGTYSATIKRVESNTFGGTAASVASSNP